jgi:hypothetical protein
MAHRCLRSVCLALTRRAELVVINSSVKRGDVEATGDNSGGQSSDSKSDQSSRWPGVSFVRRALEYFRTSGPLPGPSWQRGGGDTRWTATLKRRWKVSRSRDGSLSGGPACLPAARKEKEQTLWMRKGRGWCGKERRTQQLLEGGSADLGLCSGFGAGKGKDG